LSDPEIKNLILLFSGNTLVDVSGDFKKPAGFDSGAPFIEQTQTQSNLNGSEVSKEPAMPDYK